MSSGRRNSCSGPSCQPVRPLIGHDVESLVLLASSMFRVLSPPKDTDRASLSLRPMTAAPGTRGPGHLVAKAALAQPSDAGRGVPDRDAREAHSSLRPAARAVWRQ